MTVYNGESYVSEAIDSVLNQTISDFDFLIIDDGSTDSSVSIIKQYKDERINLVTKEKNTGLIDSLNLGLQLVKGKYVARMDSDDINLPNRFEKQLAILESNPEIQVCGCWLKTFGKKVQVIKHKEFHDEIVASMLIHCSMTMGSVMFKKKAFERFKFDETKKHVEDYDFWSRVAWSCKFYNLQEVLYLYRVHETQISKVYKDIQRQGDIAVKLFLYKKIPYDSELFTDELITKILLVDGPFSLKEFYLFNHWIKILKHSNKKVNIFAQKELEEALNAMQQRFLYKLYFSNSVNGITKKWRLKSLNKLSFKNLFWVLKKKVEKLLNRFSNER